MSSPIPRRALRVILPGLVALAWSAIAAGTAGATTYIVKPDSTGDFPTIQEALYSCNPGDSVVAWPGTYTDLWKDGAYNYNNVLMMSGVVLVSRDGPGTTILDACVGDCGEVDPRHPDLIGFTSRGAYLGGCDSTTVIKGFTIRGGHDSVSSSAGMRIYGGAPRIEDCIFEDLYGGKGGSLLIEGGASPVIIGNRFMSSFTCCGMGGAIFVDDGGGIDSIRVQILNNVFDGDSTQFAGAAIGISGYYCSGVIAGNQFLGNRAINGGGAIAIANGATPDVHDNLFDGNRGDTPSGNGGAVVYTNGAGGRFHDNIIIGNAADGAGGGIYIEDSSPEISHCTFVDNSGTTGAGAIHVREAYGEASPTFHGVLIVSNHGAGVGYAPLEGTLGSVTFSDCNVYGNDGGDFVGLPSPVGADGNRSVDPRFCPGGAPELQGCSPLLSGGAVTVGADVDTCDCTITMYPASGLAATPSATVDRRIDLSWTASPTPEVSNYLVYGDSAALADTTGRLVAITGSVTSYAHFTPTRTTWYYRIFPLAEGLIGPATSEVSAPSPTGATATAAVLQNPVVTSSADIFVVPVVPLFGAPDVSIRLALSGEPSAIPVALVPGTDDVYRGSYVFSAAGTYTLSMTLALAADFDSLLTREFAVGVVEAGRGLVVVSPDGRTRLAVPSGAAAGGTWFTAQEPGLLPGVDGRILGACRFGPETHFASPLEVEFSFAPGDVHDPAALAILQWTGSEWSPLATTVAPQEHVARASVTRPGTFRLVEGGAAPGAEMTPTIAALRQNSPNPFSGTTRLDYELPADGPARLVVYDVQGRHVRRLVDGVARAGRYAATWDGTDDGGRPVAHGVYFARLECAGSVHTVKMSLAER